MTKRFVHDLNKCTGCQACQLACIIENDLEPVNSWRQISTFNQHHAHDLPHYHFSLACNHCVDAPCMAYCPALAYTRDEKTDAVIINSEYCIGCRYCTWVCPYDAPKFNNNTGTIEKCTFCQSRLEQGKKPACVTLCPTDALTIENDDSEIIPILVEGFTETGIKPKLRIIPLKPDRKGPIKDENMISSEIGALLNQTAGYKSKVEPIKEWSLIVFTLLASWLTGLMGINIVHGSSELNLYILIAGFLGLGISASHLGKLSRSYRAVLNWRRSWLSREILFFNSFIGLVFLQWISGIEDILFSTFIITLGFLALIFIDMVYTKAQTIQPMVPHSAQATLTGLLIFSISTGLSLLAAFWGSVKLFLYLHQKYNEKPSISSGRIIFALLRIVIGLLIPFYFMFFVCQDEFCPILWAGLLIGEVIDRYEFYNTMEIIIPEIQINKDLHDRMK